MNTAAVAAITLVIAAMGKAATQDSIVSEQNITLDVRVYNLANVAASTIRRALEECSRILAGAGVQARWEPGDVNSSDAHRVDMAGTTLTSRISGRRDFLVVRFVRGLPVSARPGALGFALPDAQYGVHVTVFYDRIEALALSVPPGPAKILGNALAHEIAHVLLDSGQHSQNGIMKAVWSRADYQHMAARPLEFEADQLVSLRNQVAMRFAARGSSGSDYVARVEKNLP